MKPTQGGKRPGAGRKPRAIPRKAVTVKLEPQDVATLKAICKARGISQAGWIAERIREESEPKEIICRKCGLREQRGILPDVDF